MFELPINKQASVCVCVCVQQLKFIYICVCVCLYYFFVLSLLQSQHMMSDGSPPPSICFIRAAESYPKSQMEKEDSQLFVTFPERK